MKVLVLGGSGKIGSVIVNDVAENMPTAEVVIADRNEGRARNIITSIGRTNISLFKLDASDYDKLVKTLRKFDLAVGALPGKIGYQSVKACIHAGVNMVDISFMRENPLTLNEDALKAEVTIIPDCGEAPGLTNILVGHAVSKLDHIESIHIMDGGLPERPVPPLNYVITWSAEDLIEEYTRNARIIEDGRIVEVEALTGLEEVEFPYIGKLEAFYADSLRTLLNTIKDVKSMWAKVLRYPGHIQKIELLRTLGFFDEAPVKINNMQISPRILTINLLEKKLGKPEIKDIVVMYVEVCGIKKNLKTCYSYFLLDRYDERSGLTAMQRTTGYTASIVAQLMAKKLIKEKGVVPPEKLGMDDVLFTEIMNGLNRRGIKIRARRKILE